jgi:acetyl-CoA carboxylase biotin carboxyl carrier protein
VKASKLKVMPGLDTDLIRHALTVARERGFAEVEIETDSAYFSASLDKAKRPARPMTATAPPGLDLKSNGTLEIRSPIVGYFRLGSSPLEPGKIVNKGDVVATISALGLTNDVESAHTGEIAEVLVTEGQPVEFGQVLARLKVEA